MTAERERDVAGGGREQAEEFAAYVKGLKTKLLLGGTKALVQAIVTTALHVVELRARIASLESELAASRGAPK